MNARTTTLLLMLAGCWLSGPPGEGPPDAGGDQQTTVPFQADTPTTYVAKVKDLLVGLPPTDAEIQAVAADPTQLRPLVQGWMKLPQYQAKMLRFFELAFQQTQIADADFMMQTGCKSLMLLAPNVQALFVQNASESVARTVLLHGAQGAGITDAFTTTEFAMTTALMELYAMLDAHQIGDSDPTGVGPTVDALRSQKLQVTISGTSLGCSETDIEVPGNASCFLHFTMPNLVKQGSSCAAPHSLLASADVVHYALGGVTNMFTAGDGTQCNGVSDPSLTSSLLTKNDFTDWRLVKIRTPSSGETPTPFYQLAKMRTANELVLTVPRVGFFTTPAFFANWATNDSNTMRVTMNQALIVALGGQVDGTDPTIAQQTPGLNADHASQPACAACHQLLDPSRSVLSATYSWSYHRQDLSAQALADAGAGASPGWFAFEGVQKPLPDVMALAQALATHPAVAQAWAQKLCVWANSTPCDANDPELQRVVRVFQAANLSWDSLVLEMMTSPLVTNAAPTETTTAHGVTVAVSRLDHICASLGARLGFTDVCGVDATTTNTPQSIALTQPVAGGFPADSYGRGQVTPNLAVAPTLFYRGGVEVVCAGLAQVVVDGHTPQPSFATSMPRSWSSGVVDASGNPTALADFVTVIMGIEASDARYNDALAVLTNVYRKSLTAVTAVDGGALTPKMAATEALRSVFTMACSAPSAVSIGM